ncbi:MAG: hypothetical protein Q9182_003615 [Xanthomendoza sp. 2 TL-2023]
MSAVATRLTLRRARIFGPRSAQRPASTTSQASDAVSSTATKSKEAASNATSQASQGLSRVTSSAGPALSRFGQGVSSTLGKIGGRTGRIISSVEYRLSDLVLHETDPDLDAMILAPILQCRPELISTAALIPPTIYYTKVGFELSKIVFRGQKMSPP